MSDQDQPTSNKDKDKDKDKYINKLAEILAANKAKRKAGGKEKDKQPISRKKVEAVFSSPDSSFHWKTTICREQGHVFIIKADEVTYIRLLHAVIVQTTRKSI